MKKIKDYFKYKILGNLEGNAYACIIFEPMWAIFGGMIFFYQPLYMKSLGVNELQMGLINSIGAALMILTSFVAGPITDKYGRRKTTLIFDLISWSLVMFIWAISQNFWFFLVAALLNSLHKISYTSWTCLAIEDTIEDKRVYFFSLIMIINLASGIFAPLAGILVNRFGITLAMRLIYFLGFISMTLMFVGRNKMTTETRIGMELIKKHHNLSLSEKITDYKEAMVYFFTNKLTFLVFLIMLFTYLQNSFLFYQSIYLKDIIGIKESLTSLVPGLSAIVYLIVYFLFMKYLTQKGEASSLSLGLLLNGLGILIFLLVKPKNYLLLAFSTILTASGNIITITFRETLWSNVIGEEERAKIFAAGQGLISLFSAPAGYFAGWLYKINPALPFLMSLIFYLASYGISFVVKNIKEYMPSKRS
ncbi:MFS transporter [Caloramator sp. CAR-1]|uniref:MFS transporter n=1 Tax=Caloramator sp. CAR-1 TaxID=3062777 RepID=UPI0026E45497|nr:MFS transporter [Caloramator sp. CAR-1]MDO6355710.1 MFS transporter [Caloramator sp. CAR-1]